MPDEYQRNMHEFVFAKDLSVSHCNLFLVSTKQIGDKFNSGRCFISTREIPFKKSQFLISTLNNSIKENVLLELLLTGLIEPVHSRDTL